MSDISDRRKKSFFGSKKRSNVRLRRKLQRAIQVETLERRELMAADVSPHHNLTIAEDVNRDFRVQPRDALLVINELNRSGSHKLPGDFDPKKGGVLIDVNGDGNVSPVDALRIINKLNSGEGAGELVEFKYQFLTLDGQSLDPNPADAIEEYQVGVGQKFLFRTLVKDLRANPQSVYAAFHDIEYVNQDGSAGETASVQWGELNLLKIGSTVKSGTFTLQYGSETTAPISPVFTGGGSFDKTNTAAAIAQAVGNLNSVGGAQNVRVKSDFRLDRGDLNFFHFGIAFINAKARTNLPSAQVGQNSLRDAASASVEVTLRDNDNPAPTQSEVLLTAFDFDAKDSTGAAQSPQYNQFADGMFANPSQGNFLLDEFGALSNIILGDVNDPGAFKTVFDGVFVATKAGTVRFSGNAPDQDGTQILLLGESNSVPPDLVIFPQNIPLTVVQDLVAVADTFPRTGQPAILEDSNTIALTVSANDQLFVGSSFSVDSVTQPTGGNVSIATNGKDVNFKPKANFFGQTTFTYTIKSNLGRTSTATVTVNVSPVNDPPTVIDSAFNVGEDPIAPLTLTPGQIFSPGPGETTQTLTFVSATPVAGSINGTLSLANNIVSYAPAADFFGTALFTVEVADNLGLKGNVTVTVTVDPDNDPPVAFSGPLTVNEDTTVRIVGAGSPVDILASSSPGPSNESSQTLTLTSIQSTSAAGGTIATNAGITTYRASPNFFGTDTFTYVITDNGTPNRSTTGTVTVNVTPVNDAPNAVDDSGSGRFVVSGFANQFTQLDVLRNDNAGPNEPTDTLKVVAVGTPSRGSTVEISTDGLTVRFKPKAGIVNVEETFTYTVEDTGGLRDTATATVFIIPPVLPFAVDNLPPAINEDSTNSTNVLTIDVLADDLANAGATKRLLRFTQPANGTARLNDNGTPTDLSDDKIEYFANPNVFTPDVFTYTMIDSATGSAESTGRVTITFKEINDVPTAFNRSISGTEDVIKTIPAADLLAGLSKGPLEDSQTLVVSSVAALSGGGTVRIDGTDVIYTPAANFAGDFLFRYTVQDNGTTNGASDPKTASATVTISVAAVNDAPVVGNDQQVAVEDTAKTILLSTLLGNDKPGPVTAVDELSQTIAFKVFAGEQTTARGGKIRVEGANLVYTPADNFNGVDTFSYSVIDNGTPAAEGTGTVTITVSEVNDPPLPTTIAREAFAKLPRVLDVSAAIAAIAPGPANESSQSVTLIRVFKNATTRGSVVLNGDGTITYTSPADGSTGLDSFSYEVRDNGTTAGIADPKTAVGTITIDIKPFIPSRISGVAWIDDNDDGVIAERELKLGGVSVMLTGRALGQTSDITPVEYVTLSDGSYRFPDLPPGDYKVHFESPALTTRGSDWIETRRDTDRIANQISVSIAAPGDVQATGRNFSVLGVSPTYANLMENMSSSIYGKYPGIQNKGFYAAVGADGKASWSIKKDSFGGSLFGEIVLTNDKSQAIVTRVNANHEVFSAVVPRNRLVRVNDDSGNVLLRVLADVSDLTFAKVDLANPPSFNAREYLKSVEAVFAQEDW